MARTPAITPCSGAAGVVRTLMVVRWPAFSIARSVKVPPMSTARRAEAIRYLFLCEEDPYNSQGEKVTRPIG